MASIALCESGGRQFKGNGQVIMGGTTPDKGLFQINAIHNEEAAALGYDLDTTEGNIGYAKVLFDRNGLRDWNASKPCWGKAT